MNLEIYDTKIRKKVSLIPSKGETIRMYTCGPTVYNFAHVGNLRTYVFEDLLRRTIKFFGMKIFDKLSKQNRIQNKEQNTEQNRSEIFILQLCLVELLSLPKY